MVVEVILVHEEDSYRLLDVNVFRGTGGRLEMLERRVKVQDKNGRRWKMKKVLHAGDNVDGRLISLMNFRGCVREWN